MKPYSPPQRPTLASSPKPISGKGHLSGAESIPISTSTVGVEKDEFGRDIRPQSPRMASADKYAQPPNLSDTLIERNGLALASEGDRLTSVPQQTPSAVTSNTSSQNHSAPAAEPGLDKFNMSTFDFTAPSSWEALGKMWHVTYGYLPSQEDLMQFVMSGGVITSAAAGQYQDVMGMEQVWPQSGTGFGRQAGGAGFSSGGSGYGHVDSRNGQQHWGGRAGAGYEQKSDAIILGGGDNANTGNTLRQSSPRPSPTTPLSGEGGGLGGRMQRVGDKWVFVRDEMKS